MTSKTLLNTLISLVVGGLFLFLAFRNVPLDELGDALGHFDWRFLVPMVAVSLTMQIFRAWRWQLELRPLERIGIGKLWIVISVAYMAINVLPARIGEFVRPWLLSRRSSVTFSNVVGNLVIEKTVDSICILFFILLGLTTTADLPDWVRLGARVPAAAAVVLAVLVALLYFGGEAFVERWVVRALPEKIGTGLLRVLRSVLAGMRVLPDGRLLALVFAVSLAYWSLPILSSWIAIVAFGFDVPVNAALIVFIFIGFGTALPNAPGMIGTYQYACILALGLFGVDQAAALAYGLVLNALQIVTLVGQGLIALPLADVSVADFKRARAEYGASAEPQS